MHVSLSCENVGQVVSDARCAQQPQLPAQIMQLATLESYVYCAMSLTCYSSCLHNSRALSDVS